MEDPRQKGNPEARAEYSRRLAELEQIIEQMPADQRQHARLQLEGGSSFLFDSLRGELEWLRRQAEGE